MSHELMDRTVLAAGVALAAASVAAPFVYTALKRIGASQVISQHLPEHAAKQGTPNMGGLIMLIGVAAATLATLGSGSLPILILLAGFGAIGFLDDHLIPRMRQGSRGLGWRQKLVLQVLVSVGCLLASGRTTPALLIGGTVLILFFVNAYNFADGLDTLAGGLAILLAAGFIGLAALAGPDALALTVVPALAALALACVPFLFLNAPPAKIFMGDVGALPIGGLFGWVCLELLASSATPSMLVAPITLVGFVMILELVPVPLQIASVKLRGSRLFPFKTPIHHGLQSAGWPETRIVWTFHLAQFLACAIAFGWMWMLVRGAA